MQCPINSGLFVYGRVEIFQDLPDVDAVFVSVGGGGLIGGIAAYLKTVKPTVKVNENSKDTLVSTSKRLCTEHETM